MGICDVCGGVIEFRYVHGRCTPIHISGGCYGHGGSRAYDYSGYNVSKESTCHSTKCPKCGEEVFFIRHNGGSVWIDPPLGSPWYKHPCFDSSPSRPSLASELNIDLKEYGTRKLILGVVTSTLVVKLKTHTDITFECENKGELFLRIKNNAGFLLGKICIYDEAFRLIRPADNLGYVFLVI